ncbi:MAG: DUF3343 domain-containing protein [Clostridia bacterium]|nr:DUF3343 domain-containing protein [Clostridia bacterium]
MENIIAVFGNRNNAMQFASMLKKIGIRSKTISTPRELSVSCGISVVFSKLYLAQAKMILSKVGVGLDVRLYLCNSDLRGYYVPIR